MIALPVGCTVNYAITLDVEKLTEDMVAWFALVGGEHMCKEHYDYKGAAKVQHFVNFIV